MEDRACKTLKRLSEKFIEDEKVETFTETDNQTNHLQKVTKSPHWSSQAGKLSCYQAVLSIQQASRAILQAMCCWRIAAYSEADSRSCTRLCKV